MSPPANKHDSPSMLSRLNTSTGNRPASSRNRTSTCTRRGLLPLWQRTGEIPGGSTLIRGAGFLLARGRLRWRTRNTCLSEASCVPRSPPLAVAHKLRGTLPGSPVLLPGISPARRYSPAPAISSPQIPAKPFST